MDGTKQIIQDFFSMLEDSFFKGIDISKVVDMSEDEQRDFVLRQTERLLGETDSDGVSAAARLSGLFWSTACGRKPAKGIDNPLMMPDAREMMDDEERLLCSFYLTLAGFCHDLVYYYTFAPIVLLGLSGDDSFFVDNTELVDFVQHSAHSLVCAHIACIMRKEAVDAMEEAGYQVAYDYLSRLWWDEKGVWVVTPGDSGISAKEYVKIVISALMSVEDHLREGLERDIPQTVIFVHDELFGRFMDRFDDTALNLATEVVKYIDHACYVKSTGQMVGRRQGKPAGAKDAFMKNFADKVQELHAAYPDSGELLNSHAAMNYLCSRMEQKAMEEEC